MDPRRIRKPLTTVHVAIIEHNDGINFYAAKDKFGLEQQIYEYVKEWWNKELEDEEIPLDEETAIDYYFSVVDGEYLTIDDKVDLVKATRYRRKGKKLR